MTELDLHIHIGDQVIAGGDDATKATLAWSPTGLQAGVSTLMDEFSRIEPSDSTGVSGGTYEPYWDGQTFDITSDGTPTTTTIDWSGAAWGVDEWVGREIEFTTGTYAGQKVRVTTNTATKITFTPALAGAPSTGDEFTIKGGFVYFWPTASTQNTIPLIASQPSAKGVNWFGNNAVDQTPVWINRLVNQHGETGDGFRMYKNAGIGGVATWMTGSGNGNQLDLQVGLINDFATNDGDTLKVKSVFIDASTSDIFGFNLQYKSDLLRLIDSLRDRLEAEGITEAKSSFTATGSTTTTLTVTGSTWTVDAYKGRTVRITSGVESGVLKMVLSNTADTLTIVDLTSDGGNYGPFSTAPGTATFDILASPLIIVGNPKTGAGSSLSSGDPILSLGVRSVNREVADLSENVRLHDWESANWAVSAKFSATQSDRYYDVPSYIAGGYAIHNTVQAFYTAQPTAPPGAAIPCVVMIGTSQMVTSAMNPSIITLMNSQTLTQEASNIMPGAYIWNDVTEAVEPYNVGSNAATFGSVESMFGPEATMLRDLVRDKWPTGVVVFKFALSGVSLTADGGAGFVAGYIEPGGHWETIEAQWSKFKQAVVRDLNRSPDVVAIVDDVGENDAITAAGIAAFPTKAPLQIDRQRELFQTRVSDNYNIPTIWQQPPPPLSTTAGGSSHSPAANREILRATILDLPNQRDDVAVIPSDVNRYGLQWTDTTHYDGEAVLNLGVDWAAKIIELFSVEGEAPVVEPETAALIVETGSGLTDANSYASVAFADSYFLYQGDPSAWSGAATAAKEAALRVATSYLDDVYGGRWRGVQVSTTQTLRWPRAGARDADTGFIYGSNEIPTRLQEAAVELAYRHLTSVTLRPDITAGDGGIKSSSLSIAGLSFNDSYSGTQSTQPRFPVIDSKLRGILSSASGSMVRLSR